MKFVHENCSIECEAADIVSRNIIPSGFVEFKLLGKCTTYKCKRNSEAIIRKEIKDKANPLVNKFSKVENGDYLECEEFYLAIQSKKPLRISLIHHTGRHKAQSSATDAYTYAKITRQIPGIPKLEFTPLQIKIG